ncbi:hypothetical protein [Subtercola sp. RTI3]|uniref:hypothetical protein n=1 Tax=Subtercola sp. RTI3 TaxID=3048639 RepID=UPI002B22DC56|nr:hypothetical protein [Subtercola sp. RTI3]MEA9986513.1 nucleotidyltransferase family protein [Subtercola sp. RTI3]
MSDSREKQLRISEAVDLAHALVASVAEQAGIRALFIKGPISQRLGLRPTRQSSDVDALVDPERRDEIVADLVRLGWHKRTMWEEGHLFPLHAVNLIHSEWPCDLDLHDRYPGFFREKQEAFEILWHHKFEARIANKDVFAPDLVASSLIAAAHSARHPNQSRTKSEFPFLLAAVRNEFTAEQRTEVVAMAGELRALETLRMFLREAGADTDIKDLTSGERRLWRMSIADDSRSLGWLLQIGLASWHERPGLVLRALIPSSEQMRAIHPETGPGRSGLWCARLKRLFHGTKAVPRAIAHYLGNRNAK